MAIRSGDGLPTHYTVPADLMPDIAQQKINEFDLVCALAGADWNDAQLAHVRETGLSSGDWATVMRLAEYHGVFPLVAQRLVEDVGALTEEIQDSLRSGYDQHVRRSLWFSAELVRIMHRFENAGLRAIPFKGPVLAQTLYEDGLRSFTDLDILIAAKEFESAKGVLAEIGYRPSSEMRPAIERFWLCNGYERAFGSSAGENLVELQWALLPRFYAVDLHMEDLLARAGTTDFTGYSMPSLAPEDLLLALCLHAAKHLWTRLIWVIDIARMLCVSEIDFGLVAARAHTLGVQRILGVSFRLVEKVLSTRVPVGARTLIVRDPEEAALCDEFAMRLRHGVEYDFESTEYFRLTMKLRERYRDRWRYVWRLVWTPGPGDIAAVRLPEWLFWFYRVVRIGRLFGKLVG